MPTHDWEKEFDRKFRNLIVKNDGIRLQGYETPEEAYKELKSFIVSERTRWESELAEKVEKMKKETKQLDKVRDQSDLWKVCENNRFIGYNQSISDVLDLIRGNTK